MKGFWKWFWIVVGIIVLVLLAFAVALFFFRGGAAVGVRRGYGMMGRGVYANRLGGFGGMMMFGMGWMMFFRWLIPLGILVLAGFGVAYFVRFGQKPGQPVPALAPQATCAHCGKPLEADWAACPYCGKKVKTPKEDDSKE